MTNCKRRNRFTLVVLNPNVHNIHKNDTISHIIHEPIVGWSMIDDSIRLQRITSDTTSISTRREKKMMLGNMMKLTLNEFIYFFLWIFRLFFSFVISLWNFTQLNAKKILTKQLNFQLENFCWNFFFSF